MIWHDIRLPTSPTDGPGRVDGDVASIFGHNANGAFIAMLQEQARLTTTPDANWRNVVQNEAVLSPGDSSAPQTRVNTALTQFRHLPFFAAYRWVSYSPARAVADLAVQDPSGHLYHFPATVVWIGDGWRTELPMAGAPSATPLSSLDGFDPLPGVPR
ncbi:MAG: hypothetical protein LLG14_05380 [Nocardiaceae bacterium]|nr:hypothetical protein [Nocardiaceae bacterium]